MSKDEIDSLKYRIDQEAKILHNVNNEPSIFYPMLAQFGLGFFFGVCAGVIIGANLVL